jgi:predicted nicotinamide N-methyase
MLDWRAPAAEAVADVVLAADVLYERRNAEAVAHAFGTLVRPGGCAVLADPGRTYLKDLLAAMAGWRAERAEIAVDSPHIPQGAASIVVLAFRREPGLSD